MLSLHYNLSSFQPIILSLSFSSFLLLLLLKNIIFTHNTHLFAKTSQQILKKLSISALALVCASSLVFFSSFMGGCRTFVIGNLHLTSADCKQLKFCVLRFGNWIESPLPMKLWSMQTCVACKYYTLKAIIICWSKV